MPRPKGLKLKEEDKKKISETWLKKFKDNPRLRILRSKQIRERWKNPEYKKRVGKSITKGKTGIKVSAQGVENIRKSRIGLLSGAKHWNWRGGITHIRETIRKMFEYRLWRDDVYKRDDFTCQVCFKRGGDLEADHYPKMFSEILDKNSINTREEARLCAELWNINNGRTLCKLCHKKTYTGVLKKPWLKK